MKKDKILSIIFIIFFICFIYTNSNAETEKYVIILSDASPNLNLYEEITLTAILYGFTEEELERVSYQWQIITEKENIDIPGANQNIYHFPATIENLSLCYGIIITWY